MTKHNIWSISIIGLLFALLFTPFIMASSMYFPYVTGKVFTFRIGVSIIFILWTILVLFKPEFLPKKNSVVVASGLFVLWLVVSNTFGVDPSSSFFSNFERMEGWFTHLYLFLYLLVLSSVLQTRIIWNWFLATSVAIANILALYAAFDANSRTDVFLGNSTYVAIYILFNLFFAAFLMYGFFVKSTKDVEIKYAGIAYYISSIILFVYVIFRTQTRGTVLALVFSLLLFLILSAFSYWKNKKVKNISIALLLLGIVGATLFWQNRDAAFIQNNPLLARVANISASEGTGKARLVNWGIALEGVKENPVFGWGQENYGYVFAQKYDPAMYGQEPWFDRTHNAFLDWTIQGGIPALLFYLSLFIFALYSIHISTSITRTEKNILIVMFVAYGIHNMFVFDNYSSYLMFFTALAFVVHLSQKERLEINWDEKTKQIMVTILIIITCIISFFTIIRPMIVARDLVKVINEKDAQGILDSYKDIFSKNSFGNTEATMRFLSMSSSFSRLDKVEMKKEYLDNAMSAGEKMIYETQDVRRLETYGNFLLQTQNTTKAIEVLEKAQTIAPNRQNNLYTLGLAYISNKENEKALEVFKHAYEILPENTKAKTYYGAVLLLNGDKSGQSLIEGYSYTDPFFLSVFNKTKQYKEIIKIREQLKLDTPTDYQNQVSLAIAYLPDGQKIKAVQIIKEVQKVVPEFKGQGDALIRDIWAGKKIGE